jgi:hypothetical protein
MPMPSATPTATSAIQRMVRVSPAETSPYCTSIHTSVASIAPTSTTPNAPSDTHEARRQNAHPPIRSSPTNAFTASNVDRSRSAQSTYDHPPGFQVSNTSATANSTRVSVVPTASPPCGAHFTFAQ